jgi:RNA polymerase sigma-32 factor
MKQEEILKENVPPMDLLPSGPQDLVAAEKSGAVEVFDPLRRYLGEIRKFALLSREEELALAKRWWEEKDLQAAYRLVVSNLRLVVKIAFEYQRAYSNLLDLIQEGNLGLMQAVKKFDPYREVKLSSYASWWIRAYILKFLIDNWSLVKIGTTQAQRKLFFRLKKEKGRLEAMGFDPGPKLLAGTLNVTKEEITEMDQRLEGGDLSGRRRCGYAVQ